MSAVRRGASRNADPAIAARELAAQINGAETSAAVFFCSAEYDFDMLGAELCDRFEGVELVGCSTSGEIAPDGYADHSLVGLGFARDDYVTVAGHIDDLSVTSLVRVCELVRGLTRRLSVRAPAAHPSNTFALLLIDGLSGVEEPVLSAIVRELGEIPIVGGSAGDNLRFRETVIFHDGAFRARRAVLMLVHTWLPFEVFKTQHIVSSDVKMVVTEADPVRRVVTEINAEPASEEYARLLEVEGRTLAPMLLATHPLQVRVGGDDYTRSIRNVNDDGSLTFYCAIDEGIVLAAGRSTDIVSDLDRLFSEVTAAVGVPDAILGFDCIFRRLELQERRLERAASRLLQTNRVIGFSTYGEQYHAMHLNQTFSGVAFGGAAGRSP
ncbi:MAG: FIST N-terminal domain-containing protein [Vulcanimicrobiaceae bacterium]